MHAVEPGVAGRAWRELADALPRPRAVVIATAHWETAEPSLTAATRLQTIHDFGGFPEELYRLRYDAPGAPDVASKAAELLRGAGLVASLDAGRGIDHGAWVPLRWMYPECDVPIVQVSVQTGRHARHHYAVGRALAPLAAEEDVLVLGSGHVTHNLRDWFQHRDATAPLPYARDFAEWLATMLEAGDATSVLAWRERAPGAERAHPTDEHLLPLFVALGAAGPGAVAHRVHRGYEGAALAMDAYRFEARAA